MSGLPSLAQLVFPYIEVAVFMVGINLYLLTRLFPKPIPSPTLAAVVLVVGLLTVGLGFWGAVIYSVLDPGDASTVAVFLTVNSMMAVAGCWMLALFFRAEEKHVAGPGWGWPLLLATMFVGNELLMGVAFALALNGPGPYGGPGASGFNAALSDGIVSVWFFGAMFATMLALVLLLPIVRAERRVLVGFSLTSLIGPAVGVQPLAAAVAMAAVMAGVVVLLLLPLRESSALPGRYSWLLGGVLLGFAAMGFGELLSLLAPRTLGGTLPFALATLLVMGGEFAVLARSAFSMAGPGASPLHTERSAPSPAVPPAPTPT